MDHTYGTRCDVSALGPILENCGLNLYQATRLHVVIIQYRPQGYLMGPSKEKMSSGLN